MAAPFITSFITAPFEEGGSGYIINGFEFKFFLGEVWMFANADRSGAADDLSSGITWGEQRITGIAIPASPNNAIGSVFLAVKTAENEWSSPAFPKSFTLVAAGAGGGSLVHLYRPPMHKTLKGMMR